MHRIISFTLLLVATLACQAAGIPTLTVSFDAIDGAGENKEENTTSYEGSAPVTATFHYTLENTDGWTIETPEWRFCRAGGSLDNPYIIRYEAEPQITFSQGGTYLIALYVTLRRGEEVIEMKKDYWKLENTPLSIKTSASQIAMPNAFSPNGDGKNDFYRPKSWKSIVEFRAIIFNRWGQKLYEWSDINADGWDGTHNGHDVKQGVYYALIRAKGADGQVFEFKKDVNLLRTHDETDSSMER